MIMEALTGGALMVKVLKRLGVKYIFGVPGGQLMPFMEAASKDDGMEILTTRHEENGGHMADAVSRLTGNPAVCFGTVGPGATNMVPGVAAAYEDNIPIIAITPTNQTFCTYPHLGSIQDTNHFELYKPITKWNAVVYQRERLAEILIQAYKQAVSGRPGPVHLDIPVDIIYKTANDPEICDESFKVSGRCRGDSDLILKAAKLLCGAKRPLLLAGGGVVRAKGWNEFREIAAFGIPATTTPMGAGCVDINSERYFGTSGWLGGEPVVKALSEADVVLAVGCRFSGWVGLGREPIFCGPENQKIIQVDIDPEMIGRNLPVEIGINADAKLFLKDFKEALNECQLQTELWSEWSQSLVGTYKDYMDTVEQLADQQQDPMNEATAFKAIAESIDEDTIFTVDGGQILFWNHTFLKAGSPVNKLFTAGIAHLGFGLPFANAAKLIFPQRKVLNVTGDGSFGLTCQELETAVRYNLPSVTIILNDGCWGMIKAGQMAFYNNPVGVDFSNANYSEVASGFGAYSERVNKPEEIKPALQRAFNANRPAVIEVAVQLTPHPVDRYVGGVLCKGCELPFPPQA